jgi:hypothetical protein
MKTFEEAMLAAVPPAPPMLVALHEQLAGGTAPMRVFREKRNSVFDNLFYDVAGLTGAELAWLLKEASPEGAILSVWPEGEMGDLGVRRLKDHDALCAERGCVLNRFAIAGVGSTDIGAAAFARSIANHYGEPVGAIVAGNGVADLLAEAVGGWCFLSLANRVMHTYHSLIPTVMEQHLAARLSPSPRLREVIDAVKGRDDSQTLLEILLDPDREIRSITGHSKGCLAIAAALNALVISGDEAPIERVRNARIIMVGTVVPVPSAFRNVDQYLGALDMFGWLNSSLGAHFALIPGAGHHLNPALPLHMDLPALLARETDQPGARSAQPANIFSSTTTM